MRVEFDTILERLDELYREMEPIDQLISLEFVDVLVQQWHLNAFGGLPLNDQGKVAVEMGCDDDRLTTVI